MNTTADLDLLTLEEAAEVLKVNHETVRRLARSKKLAGFKVGDLWRFRRADVAFYVQQQLERPRKEGEL